MATESPIRMLESDESKKWIPTMDSALFSSPFSTFVDHEAVSKVFKGNAVLEEQIRAVPSRSGSAPPTIEGSLAAFQAFMEQRNSTLPTSRNDFLDCESEEQMRTDPAYISYYYANVNLNPRLPPPLISRENRNLMQFMGGFGGKNISVSKGLLDTHKEEPEESASPSKISDDPKENYAHDANVTSLAGHNGSNVDLMEGGFIQAPSSSSSTAVKGGNAHDIDTVSTTDQTLNMQESCSVSVGVHIMNSSTNSSASTVSNCRNLNLEDNVSTQSNIGSDASVVESRMKLLDVSDGVTRNHDQKRHDNIQLHHENRNLPHPSPDTTYQLPGFQAYPIPRAPYAVHQKVLPVHQSFIPNSGMVPPLYASTAAYMNPGNLFYPGVPQPGFPPSPQYALGETSMHSIFHPNFTGHLQDNAFPLPIDAYSKAAFFKQPIEVSPNPYTSQVLRPPFGGSLQGQSFQPLYEDARRIAVQCQLDALASQNDFFAASSIADKELSHRAIENLRSSPPTSMPHIRVSYGYPPNLGEPRFSAPSAISGSSIPRNIHQGLQNDLSASLHSSKDATVFSGGKGERGPESSDSSKRHSILELIKSSSSRTLELSVLSGHIVEFSTDQHGSRFIQQKLENCSSEEKESVFKEVFPQASRLMTDVFGNYVVQKFFEHGSEEQRRSLGQQLTGQVLTLSLQMYGCRVIQKALDVIELDQKVELIKELDGHVIRCVHDQNGNHVIQKCIESVPTEKIKFITSSFAGKVATLSCHPYGCRVIQRVLEHCSDEQLTHWIVDEILESTSTLAHDPYGNYVTQHVMEMGKPHQRSQIIQKLTGQFVQLSQHKFASNVVEKCIKYGNDSERDLIIEEIIAPSDNNEALLMMIKDQFANYVVQKVFEIGSEKQKETLQNCIQLHLPALKKVSYAKHIVSRYEQLAEGSIQEKNQCEKVDD